MPSDKPTKISKVSPDASAAEPDAVRRQMERILDSPVFRATTAQRAFLQFVVGKVLAGEADEIKGYTVATQVFGRREDFDQATDPIVSIQANQLRRALEHYYLTTAAGDPIRIDIPKGTYVPAFHPQPGTEKTNGVEAPSAASVGIDRSWPTLLIRPFQNLTEDPNLDYLGIGLATDLATEITRYQEARVIIAKSPDAAQRRVSDTPARFIVDGSIQVDGKGIRVSVGLVDTKTDVQIWSRAYPTAFEAGRMISFQEQVAGAVAANIACEAGVISKVLSAESKNKPPNELASYEAILKYYEFNLLFTADSFFRAFEALRFATRQEPECGLVWSMYARLYAVNYSLELFDLDTPIEKALSFAVKGVQLEPANQRVRLIMAFVFLIRGDIDAGLAEVERGYRLNPNSYLWLENIGYLMTLLGDFKRGTALIRDALKHNPFYNVVVHYPLWVDWVRQGEFRQAYAETMNFRLPGLFWDPLMKAAACGWIGKQEEGGRAVDDLLALKPDFSKHGRRLIRYYIKFDDIVDRTVDGVEKCGLQIA